MANPVIAYACESLRSSLDQPVVTTVRLPSANIIEITVIAANTKLRLPWELD